MHFLSGEYTRLKSVSLGADFASVFTVCCESRLHKKLIGSSGASLLLTLNGVIESRLRIFTFKLVAVFETQNIRGTLFLRTFFNFHKT